jgi:malate dehydrogenase
VNTPGVAADLSHIATPAKVEGYLPPDDGLKKTLTGAKVVVIPAGVPRKPGVCHSLMAGTVAFANHFADD